MGRHRWSRPRRKPTPTKECQEMLELATEQISLDSPVDVLPTILPLKLKVNLSRRCGSVETSSVGTQTDPAPLQEPPRPRTPSTQRSPPMLRTRFVRTSALLPAPIPLYPIALGLPQNSALAGQCVKHLAEQEAASSDSVDSVYMVPMENVVYSVSEKQSSYTRDAVDTEIVDILRNPHGTGRTEMLSMYDRLVDATQDGRSCYMSSSESHCPFFIGDVPFGYKCPESVRKLKQAATRGKILSWFLRIPALFFNDRNFETNFLYGHSKKKGRAAYLRPNGYVKRHLPSVAGVKASGLKLEMASSAPRDGRQPPRKLSPVPSPIDDRDVLKYINQQRQHHRESVFIECSDPGVHEDRGGSARAPAGHHQSLAAAPARSVYAKNVTNQRTASANLRANPEVRWQDSIPAYPTAVPLIPSRRRQFQRGASQSMLAKRAMPETIFESPPPSARSHRQQQRSADDSADHPAANTKAEAPSASAAQIADAPQSTSKPGRTPPPSNETPLQMFDRILRFELDRIKNVDCENLELASCDTQVPECPELPGIREAASQFARAQAACDFDAAVRAAEAAVSEAPPDKAEEAAVTGANEYRTEIVDEFHNVVPGDRLVEVVGYVGITRPVN